MNEFEQEESQMIVLITYKVSDRVIDEVREDTPDFHPEDRADLLVDVTHESGKWLHYREIRNKTDLLETLDGLYFYLDSYV